MAATSCRVLCPARRGDNMLDTRKVLGTFGFKKVQRDLGWDFETGHEVPRSIPHAICPFRCLIKKCKWEHMWFERAFLPNALSSFDKDHTSQTIIFVRGRRHSALAGYSRSPDEGGRRSLALRTMVRVFSSR